MNRAPNPDRPKAGSLLLLLGVLVLAIVAVLATQHAVAAGVGRFVANLWVSVFDVVLRLIAAIFGA